ncbi:MAG: VOC family protein [Xanthomonadales bacterium]|nr:VOC family protein [Xanthomonadales bacterium]
MTTELPLGTGRPIFHLAIPCRDLAEALAFYVDGLGAELGRHNEQRAILNFFGGQLVCHLNPEACPSQPPSMYPRHFGISFMDLASYEATLERVRAIEGVRWFREPFERYRGCLEEHRSFFILDPSNNLVEFKWYRNAESIY